MRAVLSGVDGRLEHWSVSHVDHQPGDRTTVAYAARVRWADGSTTDETLGACTGDLPDGVARLSDGTSEIGMWRYPFDPDLPGLAVAADPVRMASLAQRLGLAGGARLRVRGYRPRRRAVVEVVTPSGRMFVKVLRPERVNGLHRRYRIAADAGCPTPIPLGWSDDGLLLLAGLPGRTVRDRLLARLPIGLSPDDVVTMLDGLPSALATGAARPTWGQKAPHYANVIAATMPELAARAAAVATAVDHREPEGPAVPVHGDLYESQLMEHDGRLSGLLDIDTAGAGERLDDAGCLLAHLSVLAQIRPGAAGEITALRHRLSSRFSRDLDQAALARRVAAVVLSLATGPYRVREPKWRENTTRRVELAERWLDS